MYEMYRLQKGMVWRAGKRTETYRFEAKYIFEGRREVEGNGTAGNSYVERKSPQAGTAQLMERQVWRAGRGKEMERPCTQLCRKEWSESAGKEKKWNGSVQWKGMVRRAGRGKEMKQEWKGDAWMAE